MSKPRAIKKATVIVIACVAVFPYMAFLPFYCQKQQISLWEGRIDAYYQNPARTFPIATKTADQLQIHIDTAGRVESYRITDRFAQVGGVPVNIVVEARRTNGTYIEKWQMGPRAGHFHVEEKAP